MLQISHCILRNEVCLTQPVRFKALRICVIWLEGETVLRALIICAAAAYRVHEHAEEDEEQKWAELSQKFLGISRWLITSILLMLLPVKLLLLRASPLSLR